jgi:hypothetical protein
MAIKNILLIFLFLVIDVQVYGQSAFLDKGDWSLGPALSIFGSKNNRGFGIELNRSSNNYGISVGRSNIDGRTFFPIQGELMLLQPDRTGFLGLSAIGGYVFEKNGQSGYDFGGGLYINCSGRLPQRVFLVGGLTLSGGLNAGITYMKRSEKRIVTFSLGGVGFQNSDLFVYATLGFQFLTNKKN